jgi:hypothetical protein
LALGGSGRLIIEATEQRGTASNSVIPSSLVTHGQYLCGKNVVERSIMVRSKAEAAEIPTAGVTFLLQTECFRGHISGTEVN